MDINLAFFKEIGIFILVSIILFIFWAIKDSIDTKKEKRKKEEDQTNRKEKILANLTNEEKQERYVIINKIISYYEDIVKDNNIYDKLINGEIYSRKKLNTLKEELEAMEQSELLNKINNIKEVAEKETEKRIKNTKQEKEERERKTKLYNDLSDSKKREIETMIKMKYPNQSNNWYNNLPIYQKYDIWEAEKQGKRIDFASGFISGIAEGLIESRKNKE